MVNQKFQELKRLWGVNSSERAKIIEAMKENLLERNSGQAEYKCDYAYKDLIINIIDTNNVEDLFIVDGDMNPQGK